MDAPTSILYEIERHCNNYFNPANDPNGKRYYPDAFLELAIRIYEFTQTVIKDNGTGFTNDRYSENHDLEFSSWQKAFSRELSIYKRVKFI